MEAAGKQEPPKPETAYSVNLRTPLGEYLTSRLRSAHTEEQQRVQRGGAHQELVDFNNSPFSILVKKFSVATQYDLPVKSSIHVDLTDPNSIPEVKKFSDRILPRSVPISLTGDEVTMVVDKLNTPDPYANHEKFRAHHAMIAEFRENFKSAKGSAKNAAALKDAVGKVKSFFGGKK